MTSAQRQAAFRARKAALGFIPVTIMVPSDCAAELRLLAEKLVANRDLKVGPLRNERTGKLASLQRR